MKMKVMRWWQILLWLIGLSLSIAMVIFGIYLKTIKDSQPDTLEYPTGYCSRDIYAQQNTVYSQSDILDYTYVFSHVPYMVDVPGYTSASVGNGIVMRNQSMYLYLTECDKEEFYSVLAQEFPFSYVENADPETTGLGRLYCEEGYVNGYEVSYEILQVEVADIDGNIYTAYIVGYIVYTGGNSEAIYIGAACQDISSSILTRLRDVVYAQILTLRKVSAEEG